MVGVSWDIVLGQREYIFQGRRDCNTVSAGSMIWSAEVPLYPERRPEGQEETGAVCGGVRR